ncbi:MAG: hypothetical protein DMG06_30280 [Acidobacteria bacterium]|nr:MAG: hypothetical protein DMG06_30280 [Acidobacteriota bacterium]
MPNKPVPADAPKARAAQPESVGGLSHRASGPVAFEQENSFHTGFRMIKALFAVLLTLSHLLLASCRQAEETERIEIKTSDTSLSLDPRIGPPDLTKFRSNGAIDWQNPYIIISTSGLAVRWYARSKDYQIIGPDELAAYLVHLPLSAWPYGKLVAVQLDGVGGMEGSFKENRRKTEAILRYLGITIDWWPAA